MKKVLLSLFIIFLFHSLSSQIGIQKKEKPKQEQKKSEEVNIICGISTVRSVVYLARNVNDNNNARGIGLLLNYEAGRVFRGSIEYSFFDKFDIAPTWNNVHAKTLEVNFAAMARSVDDRLIFYPMAGISYNVFDGFFTGVNDYLNLRSIYQQSTNVSGYWFGLNAGVGFDYNFENSAIFFNYKMRLGKTAGLPVFNIQDVCLSLGYRLKIKMYSNPFSHIFRNTRSRYTLKTRKPSK